MWSRALALAACGALVAVGAYAAEDGGEIDFARQIRPILSDHCFKCHGPDTAKRGLRLDEEDVAKAPLRGGAIAVVPHSTEESKLVARVLTTDPDELMPPPEAKKPLTEEEMALLVKWIEQGAEYEEHWAFIPPTKHEPPAVEEKTWPKNPIDHFILARMEEAGLEPSREASEETLARRLYLDLIGLPPSPEELEAFLEDERPAAYERLVDELLASPQYGERWARRWLDIARYADTNGYEKDLPRSIWPYRDWVIEALNEDKPYNRFIIEQLAGDMLPGASQKDKIATGFHRNTMTNEEGGIDVEEYRYHAIVDRVRTTGTAFFGLTFSCAQCHTHKYDPMTHDEYFGVFAFLNNADEPEVPVINEKTKGERERIQSQIDGIKTSLADRFPKRPPARLKWKPAEVQRVNAAHAELEVLEDETILVKGEAPERDTYTLLLELWEDDLPTSLRIEALTHDSLPKNGPGRAPNGNFVLSEVSLAAADPLGIQYDVGLRNARADANQKGFEVGKAIDGERGTGWAIDTGNGDLNQNRAATFDFDWPDELEGGPLLLEVTLDQRHGSTHTLGRFKLSLGTEDQESRNFTGDYLEHRFNEWVREAQARAWNWEVLLPEEMEVARNTSLSLLDDGSILAHGNKPNRETATLFFDTQFDGINALRLEALTHPSLPGNGPGRAHMFMPGNFIISEIKVWAAPAGDPEAWEPVEISDASADYHADNREPTKTLDGRLDTGWMINGREGEDHRMVLNFAEPIGHMGGTRLKVKIDQHFIHQVTLGRFRIAVSSEMNKVRATDLPHEVEETLTQAPWSRTKEQDELLMEQFLMTAPELADARAEMDRLKASMPEYPTTLVMRERSAEFQRTTRLRHRGEFLSPREAVEPHTPHFLHPFPENAPRNRLSFAKWVASPKNPLLGRVLMNRMWQAFFGKGIVATLDDLGLQGEWPTHPELLDWLAVEFVDRGWSMKEMHRLVVTSATYRQSSRMTEELLAADPENKLYARMPRFRVPAEMVRDIALQASGLLHNEVGGPSVFPPQPASITSNVYGNQSYQTSTGKDRYRRGLYTYWKRVQPYASFMTFDAPSGEFVCARRERSNTPLQSLVMLNDEVYFEAAQALARRTLREAPGSFAERLDFMYLALLSRKPREAEVGAISKYYESEKAAIEAGEIDPAALNDAEGIDAGELALWTLIARAILNMDEVIMKG